MYRRYIKRLLDVILSLVMIVTLFPLMLVIAFAIKLDSKGPVLFTQTRLGKDEKRYYLYRIAP